MKQNQAYPQSFKKNSSLGRNPNHNSHHQKPRNNYTNKRAQNSDDNEHFSEESEDNYQEDSAGRVNGQEIDILYSRSKDLLQELKIQEGLSLIQEVLRLKARFHGMDTQAYKSFFNLVLGHLNETALSLFNRDLIDEAYAMLKKGQELTSPNNYYFCPKMRLLTLNNLACCLRRMGKINSALKCLQICVKILEQTGVKEYSGMTHLNICALYMQLKKHEQSIQHGNQAVHAFSLEIINLNPKSFPSTSSYTVAYQEKIKMLAIAYYNLGSEEV